MSSTSTSTTIVTPALNTSGHVNASGLFVDDDHEDIGYTDLQTVIIACVATLIPLGFALFAVFGLRMVWKSWREGSGERALRREDSSDPNKSSHLLLPDEIKTSESQFSVIPVEEVEEVLTTYNSASSGATGNHNHTSKSTANGSIITMTMKNNHLIVETEERVLGECEVQEPEAHREDARMALIHQPEDTTGFEAEVVEEEDIVISLQVGPSTGLSQSDLSVSSGGSGHAGYSYGTQLEYLGEDCNALTETFSTNSVRLKNIPFVVQPSQDIEDDELYLEQQHQLGNGMDDVQDVLPQLSNPHVGTPEQQRVTPKTS